jgi:ABC-type amino acid transport system permease subunit
MISVGFPAVQLPTGYINMQTPQQEDAVSCGVFVLQTIRSLIKAIPPSSVEAIEHIQGWGQRKTLALTIISTMRLIVQSIQQQYDAVDKSTSFTVRSNAKKRTSSRFAALL